MMFSFFFLLLLGLMKIPHLNGQQRIEEFEHIVLRFVFPSFYNSHNKSCCKLYPGGCFKLLDSTGYTCDLLRGRATKTEHDGWIEFKISNVRFVDGGYYRCIVLGTQNRIYRDYYVEISEASIHHSPSQPPLTTTIKALDTSTSLPTDSSGPVLSQDHGESPRAPWSFALPLTVIVSTTVIIFITLVIGVFYLRAKPKREQLDKHGETLSESFKQDALEMSGVVYTTVDFRAHQKPTEVYANLRMHQTRVGDSDAEHADTVEYSTLAIHHQ